MKTIRKGLPVLAALIPTRNRPDLLDRALQSIWNQSLKPNILVLVDDARMKSGEQSPNFKAIAAFAQRIGIETIPLRNRRSPGLAGACNTGLDELQRRYPAEQVFVAMLDDDDRWKPNHLELCLAQARNCDTHMVVSGIIRCDEEHPAGHEHTVPNTLDVHALLTTGQRIQGSNIFLRLDRFLEAGMFSEDLPSCTDRDLCLKLEEPGDLRITTTGVHTVVHDAHPRLGRCSAFGSPQKLEGLSGFHRKWRHRMRPDEQGEFEQRSQKLFGWKGPATLEAPPPFDVSTVGDPFEPPAPVTLIVGTTTDSSDARKIAPLLEWLYKLSSRSSNCRVLAVIVENGPRPDGGCEPLRTLVDSIGAHGLHCLYVDHERQRADASTGLFEIDTGIVGSARLPIAITRSMVAVYAAQLPMAGCFSSTAPERPGSPRHKAAIRQQCG